MTKILTRARLIGLGLVLGFVGVLYSQEPQNMERGLNILRGNLTLSTGGIVIGPGGGGTIVLEGATADAYETTFTVTDPTADRTITWPDSSGTILLSSGTTPFAADDTIFGLGSDIDSVLYHRSTSLAAGTEITGVIVGVSVKPAIAANSLIVSDVTADGDLLFLTQTAGNSQAAIFVDGSASTVNLYGAGIQLLQVDSTSVNLGLAGTTTGRLEISGSTSGTISLLPANAAGTYTLTLPSTSTAAALFYSTLTTNAIDVANSVWGVSAGLTFEGSDADTEELFLTLADPTADITISFRDDLAGTYHPLTNITADVTGGVFIMPPFGIAATDNDMTMADNTMYVYRVYIPQWITVANIYAKGTQGGDVAASDDLLGVAIYEDADAGADLASSTSADFTATADVTFDVTNVTLGPGMYRIAVCSGDGSGVSFVAGDPLDDEAIDVYNLGAVTIGTAANACVAGDPPTTTGALTTADILMPVLKLGP